MARKSSGFTLVELLVVVAIIGILVGLTLPAVQSAMESSRQNRCQGSLKEMASGVQQHVSTLGRYPTGGWGATCVGDADLGNAMAQPGGWIYNLLPYVDQQMVHDYGAGDIGVTLARNATAAQITAALATAAKTRSTHYAARLVVPLPLFICPSRRRAVTYPTSVVPQLVNAAANPITVTARSDYAINAGSGAGWSSPQTYLNCDPVVSPPAPTFPPTAPAGILTPLVQSQLFATYTGVSYQQSMIQPSHIADGASYTYLIGEKSMDPMNYTNGMGLSDTRSLYAGVSSDISRTTDWPPMQDLAGWDNNPTPPTAPTSTSDNSTDSSGVFINSRFGSAHPNGTAFAFCDGSVRVIRYNIAPGLHAALGNRADPQSPVNPALVIPDDTMLESRRLLA